MRVQDLIDELKYMNPEAEVHFSYNYGDHWRTMVAPKVSEVFEGKVEYSEYHRMHKLAEDDYEDEDRDMREVDAGSVVIIG